MVSKQPTKLAVGGKRERWMDVEEEEEGRAQGKSE
jgi:hypothetical protein